MEAIKKFFTESHRAYVHGVRDIDRKNVKRRRQAVLVLLLALAALCSGMAVVCPVLVFAFAQSPIILINMVTFVACAVTFSLTASTACHGWSGDEYINDIRALGATNGSVR